MSLWAWTVLPLALLHGLMWWRWRSLLRFQLLLDLCLVVVMGPALVSGGNLNPVRCLQPLPPYTDWQWHQSTQLQGVQSDLVFQIHPWWAEARRQVLAGELPLISDRIGGGLPLLANGQIGLWAPVMLPVWVLGPERGTTVSALWKMEAAALGAFLLLWRGWRLRWAAAVVTSLSFGCGTYQVAWLAVPLGWVTAALPWTWWMVTAALRRRARWWRVAVVALLQAWLLGCGLNPETAAIVLGSSWLAGLLLYPRRWQRLLVMAVAVIVGGVLLAWPTVGYIVGSAKAQQLRELRPNREPLPLSVRLAAGRQLLVPAIQGHPGMGDWRATYPHAPAATGVGGFALALVAAAAVRRRHRRFLFAALACCAVAATLAFRVPPLDWLLVRLPPIDHMTLPRFACLAPWGLALWAGLGLEGLLAGRGQVRGLKWLPAAMVAGVILASRPWQLGGWSLFLVALTLVGAVAVPLGAGRRPWLVWAVALEMALLAWRINPLAMPADRLPEPQLVQQVRQLVQSEGGRIIGLGPILPANLANRYGIADLRAFDPLRPRPYAGLMAALGEPEPVLGGPLTAAPPRLCGAWSVRFLLTSSAHQAQGWHPVANTSGIAIWRNPHWLPPVRLVGEVEELDGKRLLEQSEALDFAATALVEAGGPLIGAATVGLDLVSIEAAEVVADVSCDGPCLLVLARPLAPGWRASIDGRDAPLVTADVAAMGVVSPAGDHHVELRYNPWVWW